VGVATCGEVERVEDRALAIGEPLDGSAQGDAQLGLEERTLGA
jgi:hypothetical protein